MSLKEYSRHIRNSFFSIFHNDCKDTYIQLYSQHVPTSCSIFIRVVIVVLLPQQQQQLLLLLLLLLATAAAAQQLLLLLLLLLLLVLVLLTAAVANIIYDYDKTVIIFIGIMRRMIRVEFNAVSVIMHACKWHNPCHFVLRGRLISKMSCYEKHLALIWFKIQIFWWEQHFLL